MRKIELLETRLRNILNEVEEDRLTRLFKEYSDMYPRLNEKPEQRHMLEQMLKMYIHIEYDLWPKVHRLFKDGKFAEYKMLAGIMIKLMQQWDREMSKLGFTYTAQQYVPSEDRKSYDPKSVIHLKERLEELTREVKDTVATLPPETTPPPPIPIPIAKKKKDPNEKEE